jgi:ribokinase
MSGSFDVIVCGSLHLDIMLYAPHLPRPDETVVGRSWGQQCGGKGGNQAVMAARAGARVAMIGRVGSDEFGVRLRRHLEAAGVDTRSVEVDPDAGSGLSAAIVEDNGDYGAVIVSGANLRIEAGAIAAAWAALGGARVLVLQNEVSDGVNVAAATVARAAGAVVVLNAAPARAASEALLDAIDILVVNRVEAAMLSGREVTGRDSALDALTAISGPGRSVIVTLGGAGVVAQRAGAAPMFTPPKVVEVISTHGAGDCFIGALAAGIAKGDALEPAVLHANEVAADFVSQPRPPARDADRRD